MAYTISVLEKINFSPSNEVQEILQNVKTILSTVRGTVPLDREFGISYDFVDEPSPIAMMQARIEIVNAIKTYEPRATVSRVEFKTNPNDARDGKLYPVVTLEISNDG